MQPVSRLVELLEWDTRFFGFRIGQVALDGATEERLDQIDAEAADLGLRCLYGSLDPTCPGPTALDVQARGYRFVEAGVVLQRPAGPLDRRSSAVLVRPGGRADLPRLDDPPSLLAPWSRFGVDPRFGLGVAGRMFEAWIERAEADDDRLLLVAEDSGVVVGVATARRGPPDRVDLMAVDEPGAGVSQALLDAFLGWAGPGPTEAGPCAVRNVAAIRFLEGTGHRLCRTRYQYHRWFPPDVAST